MLKNDRRYTNRWPGRWSWAAIRAADYHSRRVGPKTGCPAGQKEGTEGLSCPQESEVRRTGEKGRRERRGEEGGVRRAGEKGRVRRAG